MKELYLWKDTIHGIEAHSNSKGGAWALIRAECRERGIQVPQYSEIVPASIKKYESEGHPRYKRS